MNGIFQKTLSNDLGFALSTLSEKNRQITRNIANADTPFYRAKKLVFSEVMQEYYSGSSSKKLYVTNDRHIQPYKMPPDPNDFVRRQNNPSTRNDGNDVNLDYEMTELDASAMLYDMFAQISGGKFATLKEIIRTR